MSDFKAKMYQIWVWPGNLQHSSKFHSLIWGTYIYGRVEWEGIVGKGDGMELDGKGAFPNYLQINHWV